MDRDCESICTVQTSMRSEPPTAGKIGGRLHPEGKNNVFRGPLRPVQLGRPIKKENTIVNRFPFPKGVLPAAISLFQGPPVPRAPLPRAPLSRVRWVLFSFGCLGLCLEADLYQLFCFFSGILQQFQGVHRHFLDLSQLEFVTFGKGVSSGCPRHLAMPFFLFLQCRFGEVLALLHLFQGFFIVCTYAN